MAVRGNEGVTGVTCSGARVREFSMCRWPVGEPVRREEEVGEKRMFVVGY